VVHSGSDLNIQFEFLDGVDQAVRWSEVGDAFAMFTLAMNVGQSLGEFESEYAKWPVERDPITWQTPAGRLGLTASTRVLTMAEHNRIFRDSLNDQPVPQFRLSQEKLA
jgi:hypothetical protein